VRKPGPQLVLLLAVAAALRGLALIHGSAVTAPLGDEYYYLEKASAIADGLGHPGSFRPPLWPALIGALFSLFGRGLLAVRLVQILLSLIGLALTYRIVRERFGQRAAFWSGLLWAVSPRLIHNTHFLWSETLFITLFMLFLWWLHRFDRSERPAPLLAAALALALAALTKEIVVFFALLLLPWFALRGRADWRRGLRHASLFGGCFVLLLVPWMVRNQQVHGSFVGLSNCRWFPIATGNLRAADEAAGTHERLEFLGEWRALENEVEKEAIAREAALESIRSQLPWWPLRKLRMSTVNLLSPKSQELRFIERGLYPPDLGAFARRGYVVTSLLGHLLLLAPGLAALWLVKDGRFKWTILLMIGYSWFVYAVANSTPRFLLPLLPLFYLYAGPLLARESLADGRWRRIGAVVTILLFVAIVLAGIPGDLGPAWAGRVVR
jgi:4-amino-4-deoxy-L-arabinose transferase-like glycosyltransferase